MAAKYLFFLLQLLLSEFIKMCDCKLCTVKRCVITQEKLCMYLSECKTVPWATVGICCPSGSCQSEMMDDHPQVVLARGSEETCWWFI